MSKRFSLWRGIIRAWALTSALIGIGVALGFASVAPDMQISPAELHKQLRMAGSDRVVYEIYRPHQRIAVPDSMNREDAARALTRMRQEAAPELLRPIVITYWGSFLVYLVCSYALLWALRWVKHGFSPSD